MNAPIGLAVGFARIEELEAMTSTEAIELELRRIRRAVWIQLFPWVAPKEDPPNKLWQYRNPASCVYFVEAVGTGLVKIGWTLGQLARRLGGLRACNAVPLKLLAYVNGHAETERLFHGHFSELRMHGEWFRKEGSLATYLEQFGGLT